MAHRALHQYTYTHTGRCWKAWAADVVAGHARHRSTVDARMDRTPTPAKCRPAVGNPKDAKVRAANEETTHAQVKFTPLY